MKEHITKADLGKLIYYRSDFSTTWIQHMSQQSSFDKLTAGWFNCEKTAY